MAVSSESAMTCRASAQIRSARIGFFLYGIAEEPICDASEGLLDLAVVLEKAQVRRELVRRLGEARQGVQNEVVLLSRIRLARDERRASRSPHARR